MLNKIRVILVLIIFVCLFIVYDDGKEIIQSIQVNNTIREEVIRIPKHSDDTLNRKVDFDNLLNINKDAVGWLYIPDTEIDYPVLVGERHLWLDIYGQFNQLGSLVTYESNYPNSVQEHSNKWIFGHNWYGTTMFGDLQRYSDSDYAKSHNKLYYYTKDNSYEAEFQYTKIINYWDKEFSSDKTLIDNETTITLITCDSPLGGPPRYLVVFKIIRTKNIL